MKVIGANVDNAHLCFTKLEKRHEKKKPVIWEKGKRRNGLIKVKIPGDSVGL